MSLLENATHQMHESTRAELLRMNDSIRKAELQLYELKQKRENLLTQLDSRDRFCGTTADPADPAAPSAPSDAIDHILTDIEIQPDDGDELHELLANPQEYDGLS